MRPTQIYLSLSDSEQLVFFRETCKELNIACKILKTDSTLTKASDVFLKILVVDSNSAKKLSQLLHQNKTSKDLLLVMVLSQKQPAGKWLHQGIDDIIKWPVSKAELKGRLTLYDKVRELTSKRDQVFEANLNNLVKTSTVSIWSVNLELNFISINKSYKDFCRKAYQKIPTKGMNAIDILPEALKKIWRSKYLEAIKGKKIVFEYSEKVKGSLFYYEVNITPVKENEKVTRLFVICQDVSERKQFEKQLEETNELLKKAAALGRIGFLFWNLETNQIKISDEVYELYGLDKSETYSIPDFITKVIHPDDLDYVNANLEMAIKNSKDYDIEHRIIRPDGKIVWVHAKAQLVYDEKGKALTLQGIVQDITDRKNTEQEIKNKEEQLNILIENAGDAMLVVDFETEKVLMVNRQACLSLGYTKKELLSMKLPDIDPVFVPRKLRKKIWDNLLPGKTVTLEVFHKRKDGMVFPVEIRSGIINYNGKKAVLGFARDLTERKKAEENLRLRDYALNSAANAVIITDVDGTIEWINKAFTTLTGYTFDEVTGKKPRLLKSGKHNKEFYETLWNTILAGKVWKGELINKRKDGSLYDEEEIITPIIDENNKIIRFIGIKTDITSRKKTEAELETYKNQLEELVKERTQKLEQKNKELERFNKLLLAKEFRLNELREEIINLKKQIGES